MSSHLSVVSADKRKNNLHEIYLYHRYWFFFFSSFCDSIFWGWGGYSIIKWVNAIPFHNWYLRIVDPLSLFDSVFNDFVCLPSLQCVEFIDELINAIGKKFPLKLPINAISWTFYNVLFEGIISRISDIPSEAYALCALVPSVAVLNPFMNTYLCVNMYLCVNPYLRVNMY